MVTLKGRILSVPQAENSVLTFCLETETEGWRIIRMDPLWQKRDVLFLRVGQEVTVMGEPQGDGLVARKIRITNYCRRRYPEQRK